MDWPAQIDQYTNMLFATFDFQIRLPDCSVEYYVEPHEPHFNSDELIVVTDEHGQSAPLPVALDAIIPNFVGATGRPFDLPPL